METEAQWKCGGCKKEYTFDEFHKLQKVRVKPPHEDPENQYGYTVVCSCGYLFHKHKWQIRETIRVRKKIWFFSIPLFLVDVSTVSLELNHRGYWYETMIFPQGKKILCDYQMRYKTQEEAEKNHKKIVQKLEGDKYKLKKQKEGYELILI